MPILLCTGTLFSKWQDIFSTTGPFTSSSCSAERDLNAFANKICQQQYPALNELYWRPFSVDSQHLEAATQLINDRPDELVFIWPANNICLNLDFWKETNKEAKFLLLFSSPEFDLSNYISQHPFDASQVDKVIAAWVHRTQAMLTFFMNNRDQSLLVNVESVYSKHEAFLQLLTDFFDLDSASTSLTVTPQTKQSAQIKYLAMTLLLNNQHASDIYDEIRSTASLLMDGEESISDVAERSKALITDVLNEIVTNKQICDSRLELEEELSLSHLQINQMQDELEFYFSDKQLKLEEELSMSHLQINQMQEELEFYFRRSIETEKSSKAMADYLNNDPLLKIVGQARKSQ